MASKRKNVSIEPKIQKLTFKDKHAYIELLIYWSICSGPLDFDISEFYCIYASRPHKHYKTDFTPKLSSHQHVKYGSNLMNFFLKFHFWGPGEAYVESRGTKASWRPHHTGDICTTRKTRQLSRPRSTANRFRN